MKTQISLQCPSHLVFYCFLRHIIQRRKWNGRPWWGRDGCLWSDWRVNRLVSQVDDQPGLGQGQSDKNDAASRLMYVIWTAIGDEWEILGRSGQSGVEQYKHDKKCVGGDWLDSETDWLLSKRDLKMAIVVGIDIDQHYCTWLWRWKTCMKCTECNMKMYTIYH